VHIRWQLTPQQRERAINEGRRRQTYNEARGFKGRNAAPSTGQRALTSHYVGAGGEMVVAAYLGLDHDVFTESTPVRGSSDLPGDIDVKTRTKHCYDLIVQADEEDDMRLVLVTLEAGEFRIHGWIKAADGKCQKWWKDPAGGRPAYFGPKYSLRPMDELHV
jgi:hypothetical protein